MIANGTSIKLSKNKVVGNPYGGQFSNIYQNYKIIFDLPVPLREFFFPHGYTGTHMDIYVPGQPLEHCSITKGWGKYYPF